jgi:predicted transcriptional regulator
MSEAQMPKITPLGQVATGNLDTARLIEAARGKLSFARNELDNIKRTHAMKMVEIAENARVKMEAVKDEAQEAIRSLEEETQKAAQPARDMIALVERMLDR